jgi:hypothetical protein
MVRGCDYEDESWIDAAGLRPFDKLRAGSGQTGEYARRYVFFFFAF